MLAVENISKEKQPVEYGGDEVKVGSLDAYNEDDANECSICMEREVDIVLPCLHSFCLSCCEDWFPSPHFIQPEARTIAVV